MLQSIFAWLSQAMQSSVSLALTAAFIWGVFSIILSPCHLASIPLIVGFVDAQGKMSTKRALVISTLFSLGILISIGLVGVITAALGRMFGDVGTWGNYLVALIFLGVGLHLLDILALPFLGNKAQPSFPRKGLLGAFILGLLFGIALGPCTFAFMAPVLTVSFQFASTRFIFAALLILFYGIGHCSIIILAGTFTEMVQRYLNWNEKSQGAIILRQICGALVILGGLYMIWKA